MIADIIEYGEAQFKLNKLQEDGSTLRDHLLSGWRQKHYDPRYKPEELKYSHLPFLATPVWNYYNSLSSRRAVTEFGPACITWQDLKAWQDMTGNKLQEWELKAILALDDAYISAWSEK